MSPRAADEDIPNGGQGFDEGDQGVTDEFEEEEEDIVDLSEWLQLGRAGCLTLVSCRAQGAERRAHGHAAGPERRCGVRASPAATNGGVPPLVRRAGGATLARGGRDGLGGRGSADNDVGTGFGAMADIPADSLQVRDVKTSLRLGVARCFPSPRVERAPGWRMRLFGRTVLRGRGPTGGGCGGCGVLRAQAVLPALTRLLGDSAIGGVLGAARRVGGSSRALRVITRDQQGR